MKRKSGTHITTRRTLGALEVVTIFEVTLVHWGRPNGCTERFESEPAARAYDRWLRQGIEMAYATR